MAEIKFEEISHYCDFGGKNCSGCKFFVASDEECKHDRIKYTYRGIKSTNFSIEFDLRNYLFCLTVGKKKYYCSEISVDGKELLPEDF